MCVVPDNFFCVLDLIILNFNDFFVMSVCSPLLLVILSLITLHTVSVVEKSSSAVGILLSKAGVVYGA